MYKISIDDIENEKNKTYHIDFDDDIPEIKAHVKASIDLISLGDFIEAKGKIKGIIKLECDLCLKEYDYKLDFSINEMYSSSRPANCSENFLLSRLVKSNAPLSTTSE